jgi:hypothetical protein
MLMLEMATSLKKKISHIPLGINIGWSDGG